MAVDRFGLPLDDDEQIQQMTNVFTIPTSFEKCMTIEEQLLYLELTKQDRLVAGENVTLTRNDDHTVTISVNSVGKTYRIAEVTPDEGYVAAYALVEVETGVISGSKIQIPEPGTGVTPVITATASVDSATGTPSVQVVKTGTDEAPNFAFNFHNLKGQAGQNGQNGSDGAPGYSPSANIQQTATGAVVTITDEFGTTQAEISNGSDGAPGQSGADGVSPTANVEAITGGARITITDANGTTTADIMDGSDGSDGSDGDDGVGISSIAFKETDASGNNVYTITLTNSNTYDFTANRGPQGLQGPQGIPGSGADGVGISNITFDHEDASGNYVYLVTLSNNQTYTFTAPRGPQGVQGVQGVQGNPGQSGAPGNDGVSPVANVQSITGGARITITDANGTTTADVMDGAAGQNGQNGAPGYSPTASIQQTANGATITITDENGTTTATITNGQNGSNGVGISGITFKETDANGNNVYTVTLTDSSTYDITCPKGAAGTNGISPSASVAAITGGARITITDANGTTTQDIMDGATGQTGPAGPGVPSGGTDGQVLTKDGSTDYATKWANPSGGSSLTRINYPSINIRSFASIQNFSSITLEFYHGSTQDFYLPTIILDDSHNIISTVDNAYQPYIRLKSNSNFSQASIDINIYFDLSSTSWDLTNVPRGSNNPIKSGTAILYDSNSERVTAVGTYTMYVSSTDKVFLAFHVQRLAGTSNMFGSNVEFDLYYN